MCVYASRVKIYGLAVVPSRSRERSIFGTRLRRVDFQFDGHGTLYEQLARELKRAVVEGRIPPGGRLPATRVLAETLQLSRNTVIGAYEVLRAEQLVVSHDRAGFRVPESARPIGTARVAASSSPPSRYAARLRKLGPDTLGPIRAPLRYDLRYGEPLSDARLFRAWRRRLSGAALVAGSRYPNAAGFAPLRRAIAEYLGRRRGVVCAEEDILIVGGTQQAVTLSARVVLDEGDAVAVEEPHYLFALQTLQAHGARAVSVRTDSDGMVISELAKHRPRLVCVTPSHQFPSGAVLSLERRMELLEIAARHDSWILEDDYDSEFRYGRRPIAALRSLDFAGRVIYVGSFSKTLFPSLRLGYMVCPPGLRDDLRMAKRMDDLGCPAIEQAALASFIQSRQFERHLRESVAELERRRAILLEHLRLRAGDRIEIEDTRAGLHIVAWLPGTSYRQLDRLIGLGIEHGLGLYPVHPHYRKRPPQPGLLLGYAGLSAEALRMACRIFGQCLDEAQKLPLQ